MSDEKTTSPLDGLNVRQRKYAKGIAEGKSKHQAALDAGYSPNTAKNATVNIEKRGVEAPIAELIRQKGLGEDKILEVVIEALENATRIWTTKDEMFERPDYGVKHKYLDTLLKLLDKYPATKKAVEHSGKVTINDILKLLDDDEDGDETTP
jgi:hypothetical protein